MFGWFYRWTDALRQRRYARLGDPAHARGKLGEDYAHRHLNSHGYLVVSRNYRTPSGGAEVDLVAWLRDTLVFVEVKSRSTDEYGAPERAVDEAKRRKIARAAEDYVRQADLDRRYTQIRFDVISIVFSDDGSHRLEHIQDAFRPGAFRPDGGAPPGYNSNFVHRA